MIPLGILEYVVYMLLAIPQEKTLIHGHVCK